MNKIIFNEAEFEVENFNKNTYFSGESLSSAAYVAINTNNIDTLNTVAEEVITSIKIINDRDEIIYNSQNLNAKIDSINESLIGDKMQISVNITFA